MYEAVFDVFVNENRDNSVEMGAVCDSRGFCSLCGLVALVGFTGSLQDREVTRPRHPPTLRVLNRKTLCRLALNLLLCQRSKVLLCVISTSSPLLPFCLFSKVKIS